MSEHQTIPLRAAFAAQLRAVGLGLRREALLAGGFLVFLSVWGLIDAAQDGRPIDYSRHVSSLLTAAAAVFPFAVWKGERLFGPGYLWGLPVERRRHALAKTAAGWVWLMAAVALVVAWLVSLALVTGGRLVDEEARQVVDAAGKLHLTGWRDPAWMWLTPFTGATVGYLAGSALVLGLRQPLWWIGGAVVALGVMAELGRAEQIVQHLVMGRLGLDFVLTGGTDALDTQVLLPEGGATVAWRGVPTVLGWLQATALWLGLGGLALWLATLRLRER